MTTIFCIFLLTLILVIAVAIIRAQNLFVSVMLNGILSLFLASNFFLLDAVDVALTEAAVGTGISTVLFLRTLAITGEKEHYPSTNRSITWWLVSVTALVVIYATFDLPRFADPTAPVHLHIAPWYLEMTKQVIDIPNVVTAVLGSFRGYDTLGELFVVFTAGIGVLFLLGKKRGKNQDVQLGELYGLKHYLIPRLIGRMLIPFILLFGLYVQFHGEYSPGGGFQAGAFIATSMILYTLLEGRKQALYVLPQKILTVMIICGVLLYGGVGVLCILLGGNFLDYSTLLSDPVKGEQLGLLLIELGVGITVTGVLLSIFHAFSMRGRV